MIGSNGRNSRIWKMLLLLEYLEVSCENVVFLVGDCFGYRHNICFRYCWIVETLCSSYKTSKWDISSRYTYICLIRYPPFSRWLNLHCFSYECFNKIKWLTDLKWKFDLAAWSLTLSCPGVKTSVKLKRKLPYRHKMNVS